MLLKLIPTKNEPTIHFALSFADLPSQLPAPTSWTAQLSHLMHEDLEVPATLHSLDRATGISCLLEEVALDVEANEVRCLFVDGSMERINFGLRGDKNEQALIDAITSIINDVRESTMEDQHVTRQREWEKERVRSASIMTAPVPPIKPGRQGKHKKQRSLFMHIVSSIGSIINLTTPYASTNPGHSLQNRPHPLGHRNSTSIIPSATSSLTSPTIPTPGSSPRARALRRAARSALVDTYRRFVLDELVRRFYAGPENAIGIRDKTLSMYGLENHHRRERGGFCVWILHSMRRRAFIRMEQLLEEAGPPPISEAVRLSVESMPGVCPTTMDVPLSFSDEEDEDALVDISFPTEKDHRQSNAMEVDADEYSPSKTFVHTQEDLPPRPSMVPRASSSASVHTDDSFESHATSCSSSSLSSASTAPSSFETESKVKDDASAELPLTLHIPHYSPRGSRGPSISHLSASARHEYAQLAALRARLNQLVMFATSQSRVAAEEIRGRLDMLEVRSRRRAWLNKALKMPLAGSGGGPTLGLTTPFRSSPLARYVVTADDLARRQSSISRSSIYSSTSSLSSAYFRSVSSASSASSLPPSPTSTLAKTSFTPFPSSRSRIRPKLDYGAVLASAVVEFADSSASEVQGDIMDVTDDDAQDGLVVTTREEITDEEEGELDLNDHEFELYQEDTGLAQAPARTRRHRRSMQEPMMPSLPLPIIASHGHHLYPVNEELVIDGNDELTLALLARSHPHARRGRKSSFAPSKSDSEPSTFLGCAELTDVDADGDNDGADVDIVLDLGPGLRGSASSRHPPSQSDGITPTSAQRPQPMRPAGRVRTSSMVGALLRGAKGVQRSLVGGLKPPVAAPLSADSLLCQPVSVSTDAGHQLHALASASAPKAKAVHAHLHSLPSPGPTPTPMHACNRRALDLARPPVSAAVYANVDVEMGDIEVNVQLRINDFDAAYEAKAGAVSPPAAVATMLPAEFETGLQQSSCHAQEQEFTLAMDVPRRGAASGKRWRNSRYRANCEGAPRRTKLSNVFGDEQASSLR